MQNSSAQHIPHETSYDTASKESIVKGLSDELTKTAHLIQRLPVGRDISRRDEQSAIARVGVSSCSYEYLIPEGESFD